VLTKKGSLKKLGGCQQGQSITKEQAEACLIDPSVSNSGETNAKPE
jgi:hypothetical protein